MVDSSGGVDTAVTPFAAIQRPAYARAAALAVPRPGRESWLLSHRPVYGFMSTTYAVPGVPFSPWMSYNQGAAAWGYLDNFDMVFSSHQHIAEAVQLPGLPGQLILGNAGTELDASIGYPLPTEPYTVGEGRTYPSPTSAWVQSRFGYSIATPNADAGSWTLDMRSPDGSSFARCGVKARQIYCRDS